MNLILIPLLFNFYQPNVLQSFAKQTIVAESRESGDPYTTCMEYRNIVSDHWSYEYDTSLEFKAACVAVELFE